MSDEAASRSHWIAGKPDYAELFRRRESRAGEAGQKSALALRRGWL